MTPKVVAEHEFLKQFIGTWRIESKDGYAGQETYKALGDVWVVCNGSGTMGPHSVEFVIQIGFDTAKDKFVGSWIGTPMNNLWVYEGEKTSDGNGIDLLSYGPNFDGSDGLSLYRDSYLIVSTDHRRQVSAVQQPDGTWKEFMWSDHYRI